jgi:nucleoside-specific outer membrane channel protein Tsx
LGGGLLAASQAMAGDLLLWQTNSLSYLYGKNFAINPPIQQTVTFEHADKWKYGDNFLFVDKIFYNGGRPQQRRTPTTANSARASRSARSSTGKSNSARSRTCCWP